MSGWILLLAALLSGGPPDGPEAELVRVDGRMLSGRVEQTYPQLRIRQADGQTAELVWDEVLELRCAPPGAEVPAVEGMWWHLTDGSQFVARPLSAAAGSLVLELPDGQRAQITADALAAMWHGGPADRPQPAAGGEQGSPEGEADTLHVRRGTQALELHGHVSNITAAHVELEWRGRRLEVPWERIATLVRGRTEPRSATCRVHLRDGRAFAGRISGGGAEYVAISSAIFERLVVPWEQVASIECTPGQVVYLSALAPAAYEFEPFFARRWPWARDRDLDGRPIRLGGRVWRHGICMHSRARLSWLLDGRFARFVAVVGIVDATGGRGDAEVRVRGDGRVLWSAASVRGGEPPRTVRVDVSGVRRLELEVDYGAELDLADHVAWAGARLVRPDTDEERSRP